jgi:hypothetical protein
LSARDLELPGMVFRCSGDACSHPSLSLGIVVEGLGERSSPKSIMLRSRVGSNNAQ